MSDHLPECLNGEDAPYYGPCICAPLRLAEQRGRENSPTVSTLILEGHRQGYERGKQGVLDKLNADPLRVVASYRQGVEDERKKWMSHKKRVPYTDDYIVHVEDVIDGEEGA